jgi:hypothetical protein
MAVEPDQLRSCSLFTGLGHEELEPLCDWFEVAILGDGRRSATVTTTSPATLLVMFGTEFRRLQEAQPEIAARLDAAMADRA